MFLQLLIFGVQLGVIYALIALGYTMVYGVLSLINFAHGDLVMVGAFVAYFAATIWKAPFAVALLAAMAFAGTLGMTIERLAYRPLRKRPRLSALITAIGVSVFIENFARVLPFVGPRYRPFPSLLPSKAISLGGNVPITMVQIVDIGVAVVLVLLLTYVVNRTQLGRAMRAVAFNQEAAALMGINVNRTISVTFLLGAALAGAGGVLYSLTYPMIDVLMGVWLGTKAFICAVLGGIGSIPGAVVGGIIMGVVEVFATAVYSELGYAVGFVMLIVILLVRPSGLLGSRTAEKV